MSAAPVLTGEQVAGAWREALATWDVRTRLSPPDTDVERGAGHWQGDEPLAYIDLETRRVVVNLDLLRKMDCLDSLPAVLAHEIGHHVRYPHHLGLVASLEVMQRRLLPDVEESLTNLFFDLQVNEVVGRTRAEELAAVYRGFLKRSRGLPPSFAYFLAVQEELFELESPILTPSVSAVMDREHPGWRADARQFAQTFYDLTDQHLQFAYFCSRFLPYLDPPSGGNRRSAKALPLGRDVRQPEAADYDGALQSQAAADSALREAQARGWLPEGAAEGAEADDEGILDVIRRITAGLPGSAAAEFRAVLVGSHYRRLAERYLFHPPREPATSEPSLPTTLTPWEVGDDPKAIDWTASVISSGVLAPARPLRRDLEPDGEPGEWRDVPAMEIYLDTSGSMPEPSSQVNAMTLAAQVLAASTLRHGGRVRGIIYSGSHEVSAWMYSEDVARRFLLRYAGGGTNFPFGRLAALSREEPRAIRVVISDSDFLYNLRGDRNPRVLAEAAERSLRLVALLATRGADRDPSLGPALAHPRFHLLEVSDIADLAGAAGRLAAALFEP